MRRLSLAAIALLALAGQSRADDAPVTLKAAQIGEVFCIARLGNDMAPVEGLFTTDLRTAVATANDRNAAWEKANPGDKPPLGDGIPWQTAPDYAQSCDVGLVALSKTDARVEIAYGYPESPDANFTDTLLLKRIDDTPDGAGVWRLDNIAFSTGGDLRSELASSFAGAPAAD